MAAATQLTHPLPTPAFSLIRARTAPGPFPSYSPITSHKLLGQGPDPGCGQVLQIEARALEPHLSGYTSCLATFQLCPRASYTASPCLSFVICKINASLIELLFKKKKRSLEEPMVSTTHLPTFQNKDVS